MNKLLTSIFICTVLLYGCATSQTGSDTDSLASPTPYAGTYVGTETFESGIYPFKIYIKANGKVSIVDADNIWAYGKLEGNKFTVNRYGSSPMVFKGTIVDSKITGVGLENRFLGDGTFELTLEE